MKNLEIENKGDQIIFKLNKKVFDENYLISLIKRLQTEELAMKAGFSEDVLSVAEEINQQWWTNNEADFLKGVKK
jgi:hypothetical protein